MSTWTLYARHNFSKNFFKMDVVTLASKSTQLSRGSDDGIMSFWLAPSKPHRGFRTMARKGNNPDVLPFDPEDPDSIYNMVPPTMQKAMQQINPVWFSWQESTLERNCEADSRLIRIRLKFWDEFFAAKDQGRQMSMAHVRRGTCSERYWRDGLLASPKKLAYVLTMPLDYESSIKAAHYMALTRLEQILKFPLKTGGKPNIAAADRVIKVFEILDNRVKGVATQRVQIEQKSMNVNVNKHVLPTNPKDINDELKRLEKQIEKETQSLPASEATPMPAVEITMEKVKQHDG